MLLSILAISPVSTEAHTGCTCLTRQGAPYLRLSRRIDINIDISFTPPQYQSDSSTIGSARSAVEA